MRRRRWSGSEAVVHQGFTHHLSGSLVQKSAEKAEAVLARAGGQIHSEEIGKRRKKIGQRDKRTAL